MFSCFSSAASTSSFTSFVGVSCGSSAATYGGSVADEDLGRTLRRLRRLAVLTEEELAERSGVSVDVIRQLEQRRKTRQRVQPVVGSHRCSMWPEHTRTSGMPPER
ncbi:helix-turn-helix domain-containing protein [Streptomyces sp. NPDC126933]|uniref:helix-turn-helix domain-containing protein n=1 Tax=unclassified Streptomyces TaxID=2593676 RepID=UPI0036521369